MEGGDLLVEVLGQDVDLVLVFAVLVKSSICASTWLVKEALITKLGWPVAHPRLTSRPLAAKVAYRVSSSYAPPNRCSRISDQLKAQKR
jgi:hypothetical protein